MSMFSNTLNVLNVYLLKKFQFFNDMNIIMAKIPQLPYAISSLSYECS